MHRMLKLIYIQTVENIACKLELINWIYIRMEYIYIYIYKINIINIIKLTKLMNIIKITH